MSGIVYKLLFIYRWLMSAISIQNIFINKSKSTHNKQIATDISKPIPNETTESCGQKTRYLQSDDIKSILNNWITGYYKPTHFLTIRLPENWANANEFISNSHLRMIMKIFERSLFGKHWNNL